MGQKEDATSPAQEKEDEEVNNTFDGTRQRILLCLISKFNKVIGVHTKLFSYY